MAKRILILTGIVILFLVTFEAVLAVPPPPLSLYGIVHVNGANVPPNTSIVARCSGEIFGETTEITLHNGDSWYSNLDVLGDDPETPAKDGCYANETVTFEIAGAVADQTTQWASNSYQLDLTATTGPSCYYADVQPNADHTNPALCDGDVDIADVERVAGCWNQLVSADCPVALDFDHNGTIATADVITVAGEWGWPNF